MDTLENALDIEDVFPTLEECQELASAMEHKYGIYLNGRTFHIAVEHSASAGHVIVATVLRNDKETFYYPVEARMAYTDQDMKPRSAALFLIDYIDEYFESYLTSGGETFIPIDWHDYSYEAVDFQMRGQILNRAAERLADELLESANTSQTLH